MKFLELQKLLKEKRGVIRLADIARELGVSPQAVSNWKSRDTVPYKYVAQLREALGYSNENGKKNILEIGDFATYPHYKDDNEKSISLKEGIL